MSKGEVLVIDYQEEFDVWEEEKKCILIQMDQYSALSALEK